MKKAVRSLIEPNEELYSILQSAYITGSNLATTLSIQVQVARTLFQNPTEYARLVQASDESDKEFKIHQDFTTMKYFLINTCLGEKVASKPQPSAKRSILELYDSSEDELNQEPPKKKHLPVVLQYPNDTIIAYVNRFFTRSDIHVHATVCQID